LEPTFTAVLTPKIDLQGYRPHSIYLAVFYYPVRKFNLLPKTYAHACFLLNYLPCPINVGICSHTNKNVVLVKLCLIKLRDITQIVSNSQSRECLVQASFLLILKEKGVLVQSMA
jgi:hypothetical protein